MKRTLLIILALAAGAAPVAVMTNAQAQVPPRNGPYGDRDRDGIPNRYDNYDNRRATTTMMPGAIATTTASQTVTTGSTTGCCATTTTTGSRRPTTATTIIPIASR